MTNPDPQHLAEVDREWPSLLAEDHFVMRGDDEIQGDLDAANRQGELYRQMAEHYRADLKLADRRVDRAASIANAWRGAAVLAAASWGIWAVWMAAGLVRRAL